MDSSMHSTGVESVGSAASSTARGRAVQAYGQGSPTGSSRRVAAMASTPEMQKLDPGRFATRELALTPLNAEEYQILADKYSQSRRGLWKYGIEIVDDDSNRDDETSIASRKKRAAAVAAAATGDEASLYNLSVDSFADRDNTQQHQYTKEELNAIFTPASGKARCDLCLLYYPKESMSQCVAMKSVMKLRKKWGVAQTARRYQMASYLYSKASLCVFCSQLIGGSAPGDKDKDAENEIEKAIQRQELLTTRQPKEPPLVRENNLALGQPAYMSSVADGHGPDNAVDGNTDSERDKCCRSRRELESWWEVDLEHTFPIKNVRIMCRANTYSYRMEPYWVMVSTGLIGSKSLDDAKNETVAMLKVTKRKDEVSWSLPPNTLGSCVRIQCEGIKSLQLAEVVVEKGGVTMDVAGTLKLDDEGNVVGKSKASRRLSQADSLLFGMNADTNLEMGRGSTMFGYTHTRTKTGAMHKEWVPPSKALRDEFQRSIPYGARPTTAPVVVEALAYGRNRLMNQPSDSVVVSKSRSRRIQPAVQGVLRKDISEVDDLFWKTAVRYDIKENRIQSLESVKELLGAKGVAAVREFFISCNPEPSAAPTSPTARQDSSLKSVSGGGGGGGGNSGGVFGGANDGMDVTTMQIQATSLCTGLRILGQQISALDPEEQKKKAASIAKDSQRKGKKGGRNQAKKQTYQEVIASFKHIDHLVIQSFAAKIRQLTDGEQYLPFFWEQILLLFRCILTRDLRSVPKALAVRDNTDDDDLEAQRRKMRSSGGLRKSAVVRVTNRDARATTAKELASLGAYKSVRISTSSSSATSKLKHSETVVNAFDKDALLTSTIGSAQKEAAKYPEQLAARRKKIHTLGERLPPADIEPTHLRKMCTLCHHQFPAEALDNTVAIQTLKTLRDKLKIDANFAFDEEHALSRYYRVPVCAFCSQFFDPDTEDGLTASPYEGMPITGYQAFFDDRFPDRYTPGVDVGPPPIPKNYMEVHKNDLALSTVGSLAQSEVIVDEGEANVDTPKAASQEALERFEEEEARQLANLPEYFKV